MYRLIVCYGHPEDPAAFDEHYSTTHRGLAEKIPGVVEFHAGKCSSMDGSQPPYYLIAELVFQSNESLLAGLGTPEGKAAAGDVPNFATGGATMLVTDDWIAP
ncbi:MAG: EthD family reductase [Sciscionella sp.]